MTLHPAVIASLLILASPAAAQDLISVAKQVPAARLDSTLPAVPLERWLAELRPRAIAWEVNDCGEGGDGNQAPACVEAILSLAGDTTAHASIIVLDVAGKPAVPQVFSLAIGAGLKFRGVGTLREWAAWIRDHR